MSSSSGPLRPHRRTSTPSRIGSCTGWRIATSTTRGHKLIGEIEGGKGNPTLATIHSLALGLGIEVGELFLSPGRAAGPLAPYRIGAHDVQVLREALRSADDIINRLGGSQRARRRRGR